MQMMREKIYYVVGVGINFKNGFRPYSKMKICEKVRGLDRALKILNDYFCRDRYPLAVFTGDWKVVFCDVEILAKIQESRVKPFLVDLGG